ncbi:complex I intermediate-associated protein CIA30 [Macrolepiota fuliginosa MF-IS2]|uniref:Complex I intermediate-associated protein CIA30 n=1 Tax=Macrolepiota fuliginosa MF-IS2 TaxID=1400762 RepID=A0A9P5XM97_9AGAR|nr:complex I intermediate-associated protein CIA30 [Macrolepiota fuliginosa MF-IS2]
MSHLGQYLNRSAQVLRDNAARMLLMRGAEIPSRVPRTLFTFNSQEELNAFATGCDADIGGTSTVHLELDQNIAKDKDNNASIGGQATPTGVFWGDMRLGVKHGLEGRLRGGYAGFRNKKRSSLFGELTEDVSNHRYLALRLRLGGDPSTHNSYFCNIQTDGPISTDLWQHRLYFKRRDGTWEDIYIPFDNFVRTNSGEVSDAQIEMYREKIRSIGISLLGGNSGAAGRYELGIDSIGVTNDEFIEPTARGEPRRM